MKSLLLLALTILDLACSQGKQTKDKIPKKSATNYSIDSSDLKLLSISMDTIAHRKCGASFFSDSTHAVCYLQTDLKKTAVINISDNFISLQSETDLMLKTPQEISQSFTGQGYIIQVKAYKYKKIEKHFTAYLGSLNISKGNLTRSINVYGEVYCDK